MQKDEQIDLGAVLDEDGFMRALTNMVAVNRK